MPRIQVAAVPPLPLQPRSLQDITGHGEAHWRPAHTHDLSPAAAQLLTGLIGSAHPAWNPRDLAQTLMSARHGDGTFHGRRDDVLDSFAVVTTPSGGATDHLEGAVPRVLLVDTYTALDGAVRVVLGHAAVVQRGRRLGLAAPVAHIGAGSDEITLPLHTLCRELAAGPFRTAARTLARRHDVTF